MSKKANKKNKKLNPVAIAALVLCALIVVYCGTTAWITGGTPLNPARFIQLQDFDYAIAVTGATVNQGEGIVFNEDNISSISDVRVGITQKGNGVAYMRVKISQEWLLTDGSRLQSELNLPFELSDDFYDNRSVDGYIYYKGTMVPGQEYQLITGFDEASFDATAFDNDAYKGLQLKVDVLVDAVQFNRYEAIWGLDSLPWRTANGNAA